MKLIKVMLLYGGYLYTTPEGEWHNPHRPAWCTSSKAHEWFNNGRNHNIVGPCMIGFDYYVINGIVISRGTEW